MAVVTPDGIVGKVIAVYPLASQVLLVTDPTFSVGVESQHGHLRGTLNCKSGSDCTVDYIQNEEKVDQGEVFYTSGEDRVFPKGFPVGAVSSAKPGQLMKEIHITLSGAPAGAEEVLVVLEGMHQQIPDVPVQTAGQTRLLPPPPVDPTAVPQGVKLQTEADKIKQKYQQIGEQENHVFGGLGSNLPNFNDVPKKPAAPGTAAPAGNAATTVNQPASQPATPTPAKPAGTGTEPAKSGTLGARPAANPSATTSTVAPVAKPKPPSGPVLPLGAPKPKPETTQKATQTTSRQTAQPQTSPAKPPNAPPPNE
jgi:rod shape-determining protein MreC